MSDKHHHNQEGAVMLFALLLLLVMMTIGIVLASLIYREVQIARAFPDSLKAYYAAESGIEENLDIISHRRKVGSLLDEPDDGAFPETQNDVIDRLTSVGEVTLSNEAVYTIDTTETTGAVDSVDFPVVYRNGTQVELYDPDDISSGVGARSVRYHWNPGVCENPATSTYQQLEFSYNVLDPASPTLTEEFVKDPLIDCTVASSDPGYACQHTANWLATTKNYVIRVAPLDCTVPRMKVEFFDQQSAGGNIVPIPSVIRMMSVGEAGRSQRRIEVTTNWVPRASGLSDFVIFAIEPIIKGTASFGGTGDPDPGGGTITGPGPQP